MHKLAFALLLVAGCVGAQTAVVRESLPHPAAADKRIELFWTKPEGDGRYPAVLFIHGHQDHPRNGGDVYWRSGRLEIMARTGYVAAAVSQPGYGHSDGPPDFCGPFTQEALLAALEFLRGQAFVRADKIALYGYSRGAIAAAMVAARDSRLAAVVLGAGAYDFFTLYPTDIPGINRLIQTEAGTSERAFRARSALYHAASIRMPVLLLHGAQDNRIPSAQAALFAEKLAAQGTPVTLRIFPGTGHGIPAPDQYREVLPFLAAHLR
jgi:dipeptidyl aminopeptidase/acylaminoacyl peptidase